MAVSILSVVQVDSDQASSSTSVTVPAGTTLAVLCVGGWVVGGFTLTSASLGGSALTEIEEITGNDFQNGMVAYLNAPSTGSQTFAWTISTAPAEGAIYLLVFFDGTDSTTPVRDSAGTSSASADYSSPAITTVSGDYVLAFHSGYGAAATITAGGQTEQYQSTAYRNQYSALGSKTASSTSETVSVSGAQSGTTLFGVAIVPSAAPPAETGGTLTPLRGMVGP